MRDQIGPALRDQNDPAKSPVWFRFWVRLGARSGVRFGIDFLVEFVALKGPSVQAFASWLLAAGFRLPPVACSLLAAGCGQLAAGSWVLRILGASFPGCWLLATAGCCWLRAAGCWLLAARRWLLAAGRNSHCKAARNDTRNSAVTVLVPEKVPRYAGLFWERFYAYGNQKLRSTDC